MAEKWRHKLQADAYDFAPDIQRLQHQPPSPLPHAVLRCLLALLLCMLLWSVFGRLDIIAVAQGKLVPQSWVKIVQPAEAGIVKEILVSEGDEVRAGQVLARMDTQFSDADGRSLESELNLKSMQLRRADAQLADVPLQPNSDDPPELFAQINAQYLARRKAYADALGTARAQHHKARQELQSALEIETKLRSCLKT